MRKDRRTKGNLTSVQIQNSVFEEHHTSRHITHERYEMCCISYTTRYSMQLHR